MSGQRHKLLVATDGSDQAQKMVNFVGEAVPPNTTEIVVYQVMGKVPEVFWDLGKDPLWKDQIEEVRAWERQQESEAKSSMNIADQLLISAGINPANITTRIGGQQEGIARDIVAEARWGYDVLVVGRGRSGSHPEAPLGSVASKIVHAFTDASLWLIGSQPDAGNILVALDASENALRAVKHAGSMLNRNNNRITLFHVIRGITTSAKDMAEIFPELYCKRLLEDAAREIQPAMSMAQQWLTDMDISPERISTKIVTGAASRAAAIVKEARQGGYGTIVAGRKGVSQVADFSMGRVTNKLVQLAREQALCIVS